VRRLLPPAPVSRELNALGIELMVRKIRQTAQNFGVSYDRWYSERSLYDPEGAYDTAMQILRSHGQLR
jgi:arginyl-tRNA synthetase